MDDFEGTGCHKYCEKCEEYQIGHKIGDVKPSAICSPVTERHWKSVLRGHLNFDKTKMVA